MNLKFITITLIFGTLLFSSNIKESSAQIVGWSLGISGSFESPTSWIGNVIPGLVNDVSIAATGTYTVTASASHTIANMAIGTANSVITFSIAAGQNFTVTGNMIVNGTVNFILGASAKLFVNGRIIASTGAGTLDISVGSNATVTPTSIEATGGANVVFEGNGDLIITNSSVVAQNGANVIAGVRTFVSSTTNFTTSVGSAIIFRATLSLQTSVNVTANLVFTTGSSIVTQAQNTTLVVVGNIWFIANSTVSNTVIACQASLTVQSQSNITVTNSTLQVSSQNSIQLNGQMNLNSGIVNGNTITFGQNTVVYSSGNSGINTTNDINVNDTNFISTNGNLYFGNDFQVSGSGNSNEFVLLVGNINVYGDIDVEDSGDLRIGGTTSNVTCQDVEFDTNTVYTIQANATSSAQIIASGAADFAGDIVINLCTASNANITVAQYTSYTGAFATLQVAVTGCTSLAGGNNRRQTGNGYKMTYGSNNAQAQKSNDATTGAASTTGVASTTGAITTATATGSTTSEENSDATKLSVALLSLTILASLL